MKTNSTCPKCQSSDIEESDIEYKDNEIYMTLFCNSCGCEFLEVYVRDDKQIEIIA